MLFFHKKKLKHIFPVLQVGFFTKTENGNEMGLEVPDFDDFDGILYYFSRGIRSRPSRGRFRPSSDQKMSNPFSEAHAEGTPFHSPGMETLEKPRKAWKGKKTASHICASHICPSPNPSPVGTRASQAYWRPGEHVTLLWRRQQEYFPD